MWPVGFGMPEWSDHPFWQNETQPKRSPTSSLVPGGTPFSCPYGSSLPPSHAKWLVAKGHNPGHRNGILPAPKSPLKCVFEAIKTSAHFGWGAVIATRCKSGEMPQQLRHPYVTKASGYPCHIGPQSGHTLVKGQMLNMQAPQGICSSSPGCPVCSSPGTRQPKRRSVDHPSAHP